MIHSQWYGNIKKWKKKSIQKRKDRSQVFYDMSILGRGIDALLEFKYAKAFGYHQIFKDIKKIVTSTDKAKTGFIVNINFTSTKPLYKNRANMIKWLKFKIKNFEDKIKWFGVHKNRKTVVYYYYLFYNNNNNYQKIILQIKNSKTKPIKVIYNDTNTNFNNI